MMRRQNLSITGLGAIMVMMGLVCLGVQEYRDIGKGYSHGMAFMT